MAILASEFIREQSDQQMVARERYAAPEPFPPIAWRDNPKRKLHEWEGPRYACMGNPPWQWQVWSTEQGRIICFGREGRGVWSKMNYPRHLLVELVRNARPDIDLSKELGDWLRPSPEDQGNGDG